MCRSLVHCLATRWGLKKKIEFLYLKKFFSSLFVTSVCKWQVRTLWSNLSFRIVSQDGDHGDGGPYDHPHDFFALKHVFN